MLSVCESLGTRPGVRDASGGSEQGPREETGVRSLSEWTRQGADGSSSRSRILLPAAPPSALAVPTEDHPELSDAGLRPPSPLPGPPSAALVCFRTPVQK